MQEFEKLGLFYLGRPLDPTTQQDPGGGRQALLYDSRDLLTHAVCVGMTGSGKTGLCIGLLEEAAIDGVPAVVIDPKGDLTNLLLTFPDLGASDFAPWVQPASAGRRRISTRPAPSATPRAPMPPRARRSWPKRPIRSARCCARSTRSRPTC